MYHTFFIYFLELINIASILSGTNINLYILLFIVNIRSFKKTVDSFKILSEKQFHMFKTNKKLEELTILLVFLFFIFLIMIIPISLFYVKHDIIWLSFHLLERIFAFMYLFNSRKMFIYNIELSKGNISVGGTVQGYRKNRIKFLKDPIKLKFQNFYKYL